MNTIRTCTVGIAALTVMTACSGKVWAEPIVLVHDGKTHTAIHVAAAVMDDDRQPPAGTDATAESYRRRLRESVRDLAAYLERAGGPL